MAGHCSGWRRSQARRSWCGYVSATTVFTTPEPAWSGSAGWWRAATSLPETEPGLRTQAARSVIMVRPGGGANTAGMVTERNGSSSGQSPLSRRLYGGRVVGPDSRRCARRIVLDGREVAAAAPLVERVHGGGHRVRGRNRAPPDIAWPSRFGRVTDSAVLVAVA